MNDGANGALYAFKRKIADKLIFSKWREALGGQVKVIVFGWCGPAAPIGTCVLLCRIEDSGRLRTYGNVSRNCCKPQRPSTFALWKVGPVLDNVEVKIAEDGEILMKGPSLMMGYYKDPGKNCRESMKTAGSIPVILVSCRDLNILKITDRKKGNIQAFHG